MTSPDRPALKVRSTADLLAAVPYLIGFHPSQSVLLIGLADNRIVVGTRADLPDTFVPAHELQTMLAHQILAAVRADATAAIIVGYGPAAQVTPVIDAARELLDSCDMQLIDALRVTDGRYFSYLCDEPVCCPPQGVPFDPSSSVFAAHATVAGHTALPDRAAVVRSVAPVEGAARASMQQASARMSRRLAELTGKGGAAAAIRAGQEAVAQAFARSEKAGRLTDEEMAWLIVLLTVIAVRDMAWLQTDDKHWHVRLWLDATRRAQPHLVAGPASLLAFAAWRSGNGVLATIAVDRALAVEPEYQMALLVQQALSTATPPSALDGWQQRIATDSTVTTRLGKESR